MASVRVGASGYAIGVDMLLEMIELGVIWLLKVTYTNMEFRLEEIEYMPVSDAFFDRIIKNHIPIALRIDHFFEYT